MGTFLVFILKSTFCLAGFYLFYRLLLSRDTFHRFNRIALLGVILFSVLIPFIRFVTDEPAVIQQPVLDMDALLLMAQTEVDAAFEPTSLSTWLTTLFVIYVSGCLFFTFRFLASIGYIVRLIRSGEGISYEKGIRLVITEKPVSPFSWMRYIVISRMDMEENGREILVHERAHIEAGHSFDMLLAGLCSIVHWFNPASWLLKQELQNVHEYEADEQVIRQGVDEKHYQLLLIKKAVGSQRFTSMANSFNHSKLKKRITMMLRQKSSPWGRLKYLYVLPLAAFTIVAFARPEISRKLEKISEVELAEALVSPQKEQVRLEKEQAQKEKEGSKQETHKEKELEQKEVLEEKQVAREDKEQVKRDVKQEASDAKQQAKEVVVEKQKDGVYEVAAPAGEGEVIVVGYGKTGEAPISIPGKRELNFDVKTNLIPGANVRIKPGSANPLILVDGIELTGTMDDLDPTTIESISVLKDKASTKLYGEKAKNGVILIITKKANRSILK